jgi:hypothetical protein
MQGNQERNEEKRKHPTIREHPEQRRQEETGQEGRQRCERGRAAAFRGAANKQTPALGLNPCSRARATGSEVAVRIGRV